MRARDKSQTGRKKLDFGKKQKKRLIQRLKETINGSDLELILRSNAFISEMTLKISLQIYLSNAAL